MFGYAKPVKIKYGSPHRRGTELQMDTDSAALKYTHAEQLGRAQAAQLAKDTGKPKLARYIGFHGESLLVRMLWYTDVSRLFFSPFAHAFLRGVFRGSS
jgi:hypothetical protein